MDTTVVILGICLSLMGSAYSDCYNAKLCSDFMTNGTTLDRYSSNNFYRFTFKELVENLDVLCSKKDKLKSCIGHFKTCPDFEEVPKMLPFSYNIEKQLDVICENIYVFQDAGICLINANVDGIHCKDYASRVAKRSSVPGNYCRLIEDGLEICPKVKTGARCISRALSLLSDEGIHVPCKDIFTNMTKQH